MKDEMGRARKKGTIAVLSCLLALWACTDERPPGPLPCMTDEDCAAEETCYQGACRSGCTTSDDCKGAQVCVSGACLTTCTGDADCPAGESCQAGYCQIDEPDLDGGDGDGSGPTCVDQDNDNYGENCLAGPDCDDTDRTVHPNANEQCGNGVDDVYKHNAHRPVLALDTANRKATQEQQRLRVASQNVPTYRIDVAAWVDDVLESFT